MRLDVLTDMMSAAGIGVLGQSLFEDEMPADCREGVLLRLPLEGIPIDHELPGYFKGEVQAIVRAQVSERGEALAKRVSSLLTIMSTNLADGEGRAVYQINYLRPRTLPIVYKRSDGNGKEWSINLDVSYAVL